MGTRAPVPVPGRSSRRSSPIFHRNANRKRTGGEESRPASKEPNASTSRGKSSGPPGVGSAHTSSRRKSCAISWICQGCEVWADSGSGIAISIHTVAYPYGTV